MADAWDIAVNRAFGNEGNFFKTLQQIFLDIDMIYGISLSFSSTCI